jgi:tight adherence protein C
MIFVVPVLIAIAFLTAGYALYLLRRGGSRITQRLQAVQQEAQAYEPLPDPVQDELPLVGKLVGSLAPLLPGQMTSEVLRWDLAQAGFRATGAARVFVGARLLVTAAFTVACWMVTASLHRVQGEVLMVTLVGVAIGYMAPVAFLRWKQARRREEITLALPDALDLMVICVEAGLGLNAAILNVGREIRLNSRALSDELRMVNYEMRAGVSRVDALRHLAVRTGVDEVRAFVAVLVQSERFGTSIAQALRTHAVSLRTRRRQRAEEAARKTPVKMVFPLVFCIFPELLLVILAPGMLQLFRALLDMASE